MPAPAVLQQSASLANVNGSSDLIESWTVTAGSTLIMAIHQRDNAAVHAARDSVAGLWSTVVEDAFAAHSNGTSIHAIENHPGGAIDIFAESTPAASKRIFVWEITAAVVGVVGSFVIDSNTRFFFHAAEPGLTSSPDVFALASITWNRNTQGLVNPTPGWTQLYGDDGSIPDHSQILASDSPLADERAPIDTFGSPRAALGCGVMAFWNTSGAAPTPLTVDDSTHGQASDELALDVVTPVTVLPSTHGQASDELALVQASVLAVEASGHLQASDELILGAETTLIVFPDEHVHLSDEIALVQASALAVLDAAHGHVSPELLLTTGLQIDVDAVRHGQNSDELALPFDALLVPADVRHPHAADELVLGALGLLVLEDVRHAHGSTLVIILDETVGVAEREGTLVLVEPDPLVVLEAEPIVIVQ